MRRHAAPPVQGVRRVIPVRFWVFWPKMGGKTRKRSGMTSLGSPGVSPQSVSGFLAEKGPGVGQSRRSRREAGAAARAAARPELPPEPQVCPTESTHKRPRPGAAPGRSSACGELPWSQFCLWEASLVALARKQARNCHANKQNLQSPFQKCVHPLSLPLSLSLPCPLPAIS